MRKDKQKILDERYIEMSLIWSKNSKSKRKKVGALLVKNGSIISDGYNGTPSGFDNNCEIEIETEGRIELKTKKEVLHAESNAIAKVAKSNYSSEGSTLYTTLSPCVECAKLIIQSGIKRVVYLEKYSGDCGIPLLEKTNIDIVKLNL